MDDYNDNPEGDYYGSQQYDVTVYLHSNEVGVRPVDICEIYYSAEVSEWSKDGAVLIATGEGKTVAAAVAKAFEEVYDFDPD